MKKYIWALFAPILALSFLILNVDLSPLQVLGKKEPSTNAGIDIRSIVAEKTPDMQPAAQMRLKLLPGETISLAGLPQGVYLSTIKFDRRSNAYFRISLPEQETPNLFVLTSDQGQLQNLTLTGVKNRTLVAFDIGQDDTICAALHSPARIGYIATFNLSGALISEIDTGSFLPTRIAFDAEGRIWTLGQLYRSTIGGVTLEDVQLRVYGKSGELISVPAGGFDVQDAGRSTLLVGENDMLCASYVRSRVFRFKEAGFADARVYPFQYSTNLEQSKVEQIVIRARRLIEGAGRIDGNIVWYGNIEDRERQGVYPKSFIGMTTLNGDPLTPEIELPTEYRSPAGIDPHGNLYVYSKLNNRLALIKLKIVVHQS